MGLRREVHLRDWSAFAAALRFQEASNSGSAAGFRLSAISRLLFKRFHLVMALTASLRPRNNDAIVQRRCLLPPELVWDPMRSLRLLAPAAWVRIII